MNNLLNHKKLVVLVMLAILVVGQIPMRMINSTIKASEKTVDFGHSFTTDITILDPLTSQEITELREGDLVTLSYSYEIPSSEDIKYGDTMTIDLPAHFITYASFASDAIYSEDGKVIATKKSLDGAKHSSATFSFVDFDNSGDSTLGNVLITAIWDSQKHEIGGQDVIFNTKNGQKLKTINVLPHTEGAFGWYDDKYLSSNNNLANSWEVDHTINNFIAVKMLTDQINALHPDKDPLPKDLRAGTALFYGKDTSNRYLDNYIAYCLDPFHNLYEAGESAGVNYLHDMVGEEAAKEIMKTMSVALSISIRNYGVEIGSNGSTRKPLTFPSENTIEGQRSRYFMTAGNMLAWQMTMANNLDPEFRYDNFKLEHMQPYLAGNGTSVDLSSEMQTIRQVADLYEDVSYFKTGKHKTFVEDQFEVMSIPVNGNLWYYHDIDFSASENLDMLNGIPTDGHIPEKLTVEPNQHFGGKEVKIVIKKSTRNPQVADPGYTGVYETGNQYKGLLTMPEEYDIEQTITLYMDEEVEPEPGTSEPATSEPTTSEPATSEPATSEPATSEPATSEPGTSEPATSEPATSEPATSEPATSEPATSEPATSEPATSEPATSEPATSEPATSEPATSEPATSEPGTSTPSTSTPSTSTPSTSTPSTSEPATSEPGTSTPSTSEPATSEPGTSTPSTSEPATSEPGTSTPNTSTPSTSEPATSESGTSTPSTSEPATSEPATSEPGTSTPSTSESTTTETTDSSTTTTETTTEPSEPETPDLKTIATGKNGEKAFEPGEKVTIIDQVYYEGLTPGNEYTIEGILMDKETKKPVEVNGKPVTGTTTFTAKKASGMEEVVFELDASELEGKELVVFEKLLYMNAEIANHEDINDPGQTVRITNPPVPDKPTQPNRPNLPDTQGQSSSKPTGSTSTTTPVTRGILPSTGEATTIYVSLAGVLLLTLGAVFGLSRYRK
jgi:LPXTG-motif cell wall-anchored protein